MNRFFSKASRLSLLLVSLLIPFSAIPQNSKNLAEMLGYPKDSKLLIIHADDMGLSHSVNMAVSAAFERKGITSGSIMVPCPWANEMFKYVREHPGLDVGIHLTLTSEWDLYKWGGISPSDKIPSLLDKNSYFPPSVGQLGKTAKAAEARSELRAQIDRAISYGVQPTHLDTHMGSVMANPELIRVYLDLSSEYNLPVLFPRQYVGMLPPDIAAEFGKKIFLLDNLFMLEPGMITGSWIDPYTKALSEMKPGLNQIIVHIGVNNDELKAICAGQKDYGSEWRQNDLDLVLGNELGDQIKKNNIILITWKQIRDLMNEGAH